MAELIKVYNDRKYNVGVITLTGAGRNILPGSFTMLTEDDIMYIESQCAHDKRVFGTGKLRIETSKADKIIKTLEELGIEEAQDDFYIEKEEIIALLKGKVGLLKEWLETIYAPEYLDEIFRLAKELDLPTSKIRLLKEKMPEKNFVDDDE